MTDSQLYKLARRYGANALEWRRKFLGLLPEIYKRRLYEKKGFGSIFEFAAKLGGVSAEQVRRVLNLEKSFASLPLLHSALVEGDLSVHKLARVASIASPANEEELVAACRVLPKSSVEVFVRDFKSENGLSKPKIEAKAVPGHSLELSEDVRKKLLDLQDRGLDVNDLLLEFLEQRERRLREEKANVAASLPEESSRHVPVRVRRVLEKEHGKQCSMPSCKRLAVHLHHTRFFSLLPSHDPRYIAPLCKQHHDIAHMASLKSFRLRNRSGP